MSAETESFNPVRSWIVVVAAAAFLLCGSSSLNMLTPILSLLLEDLGQTTNFGSMLYSMDTIISAILAVPTGFAINRWGLRAVGFVGYVVLLVAFLWGAIPEAWRHSSRFACSRASATSSLPSSASRS